jgi:hypothetical protein
MRRGGCSVTPNTSATGGYILPTSTLPIQGKLTLEQFVQSVLVGISGLPGNLIRPKFQVKPPQQPEVEVNWIAFDANESIPDTYAYETTNAQGQTINERQETLLIKCSFYGPNGLGYYKLVRDGLQMTQNLEALRAARIAFTEISRAIHMPELINERWFSRYEAEISLRVETVRTYPVLSLLSCAGTINTDTGLVFNMQTPE